MLNHLYILCILKVIVNKEKREKKIKKITLIIFAAIVFTLQGCSSEDDLSGHTYNLRAENLYEVRDAIRVVTLQFESGTVEVINSTAPRPLDGTYSLDENTLTIDLENDYEEYHLKVDDLVKTSEGNFEGILSTFDFDTEFEEDRYAIQVMKNRIEGAEAELDYYEDNDDEQDDEENS